MSVHIFGIRHHGPGSARSLRAALEALAPDAILVEGPPDADEVLPLLAHDEMRPPVALLVYRPDAPARAAYFPLAVFSPEWQAIQYGLTRAIPVRFMDLPQSYQLAVEPDGLLSSQTSVLSPKSDPLGLLAEAAGYSDGERWWEHMVEQRRDARDLFAAVLEAMAILRTETPAAANETEARREAHMRQTIRAAEREGFARVAVVCGAWHAPALVERPPEAADRALLLGLPRVKVAATWVPWTRGRLTFASGYGAGVESPGWYHHLWSAGEPVAAGWLTRVARLLRAEGLDASAAHVIEAVRLSETLAALRDRPLPGLPELNEATLSVLCGGNDLPLKLIHEKLIVGEALGEVPASTPMVPLQQDLQREQRRLRLPPEASLRTLDLDLRNATDLARSHLLHRLALLAIPWGERIQVTGKSGTFHELWRLQWQPELAVALIEAGAWGNTIAAAATARARDLADRAPDLPALTTLVDRALLAELPEAVTHVMARLQTEAALASDTGQLMGALPPLAGVLRYGNVRQTDASMVGQVVDGLVARVCIGLPGACASLDDEAAAAMLERLVAVHDAIARLQDAEHVAEWRRTLRLLTDQRGLHGLIAGRACRLLLEAHELAPDEVTRRLSLALSPAGEPSQSAAWIEGFLRGGGALLLHDDRLWQVLDAWVAALPADTFTQLLPLLRRTFATFPAPERRRLGERARRDGAGPAAYRPTSDAADFDQERAEAVLPLVARLLGLPG
jgi:hypothetical protein